MALKTNERHWEVMLNFLSSHSELVSGQFRSPDGKIRQKKLWEELANKLNSLGYGVKSADKWQKTWTDYKYNLKKKLPTLKKNKIKQEEKLENDEIGLNSTTESIMKKTTTVTSISDNLKNYNENDGSAGTSSAKDKKNVKMSYDALTVNYEHNYSYDAPKLKRHKGEMEAAYTETITVLKEINATVDKRLGQIYEVLKDIRDKKM